MIMVDKRKLYLVQIACGEYGNMEIPGNKDNPEILKYFSDFDSARDSSEEDAWCAVSLRWCCKQAGLPYSDKLTARSWLKVGKETKTPEIGDIVVYWRSHPDSWMGHVGIFIRKLDSLVYTLGGNQDNMFCIKSYHESRVLGYRDLT